MRRFLVSCCAAVVMALSFATPASACMTNPEPRPADLWPGEKVDTSLRGAVVGVFESETTERSPGDGDGEWSVTVITRYWGSPPLNTGSEKHGPFHQTSCHFPRLGAVGDHHYGYVYEHPDGNRARGRATGAFSEVGPVLNAVQEAMLAERFGPPQIPAVTPPVDDTAPVAVTTPTVDPTMARDTASIADSSTTRVMPWRLTFSVTVAGVAIAIVWWRRSIEKRQVDPVSAASEVDDDLS